MMVKDTSITVWRQADVDRTTGESPKIKCVEISRPQHGGKYITEELGALFSEAESLFKEDQVEEELLFTVIEMTREEIDALPEFQGW